MSSSHERSQERGEERWGKCPGSFYSSCLCVSLPHPWVPSTKPNYFPLTEAWLVTSVLKGCRATLAVISFHKGNFRVIFFGVVKFIMNSSFRLPSLTDCFQSVKYRGDGGSVFSLLNGESAMEYFCKKSNVNNLVNGPRHICYQTFHHH